MTFEVMGLEIGILRVRDVRALDGVRPGVRVGVLVLGPPGEPLFVGDVALTTKRSGYGEHLALVCPACMRPKGILYVRSASLSCATCSRTRTRRQRERTLASWRRGGREEDRLLRMVERGAPLAPMRVLVHEIVEGDLDRFDVILERYHDIVVLMEVEQHGAR